MHRIFRRAFTIFGLTALLAMTIAVAVPSAMAAPQKAGAQTCGSSLHGSFVKTPTANGYNCKVDLENACPDGNAYGVRGAADAAAVNSLDGSLRSKLRPPKTSGNAAQVSCFGKPGYDWRKKVIRTCEVDENRERKCHNKTVRNMQRTVHCNSTFREVGQETKKGTDNVFTCQSGDYGCGAGFRLQTTQDPFFFQCVRVSAQSTAPMKTTGTCPNGFEKLSLSDNPSRAKAGMENGYRCRLMTEQSCKQARAYGVGHSGNDQFANSTLPQSLHPMLKPASLTSRGANVTCWASDGVEQEEKTVKSCEPKEGGGTICKYKKVTHSKVVSQCSSGYQRDKQETEGTAIVFTCRSPAYKCAHGYNLVKDKQDPLVFTCMAQSDAKPMPQRGPMQHDAPAPRDDGGVTHMR